MVKKEIRKNKKRIVFIVSSILLILIIIILILNMFYTFSIVQKEVIYTSFIAGDHVGFDLNKTALTFGMIQPGQSGSRSIDITNDYDKDIRIIVKVKGDISEYLIVDKNDFILKAGGSEELNFDAYPTEDLEFRTYDGYVTIIFKKIGCFEK